MNMRQFYIFSTPKQNPSKHLFLNISSNGVFSICPDKIVITCEYSKSYTLF